MVEVFSLSSSASWQLWPSPSLAYRPAIIKIDYKTHYLGRFSDIETAKRAWNDAAIAARGEFAVLNNT